MIWFFLGWFVGACFGVLVAVRCYESDDDRPQCRIRHRQPRIIPLRSHKRRAGEIVP